METPLISFVALRRESRCPVDNRLVWSADELRRILTAVRTRIHIEGKNAFDAQMAPARAYESPRGLYRYLTGDLFNSTTIRQEPGYLVLEWRYPSVILNSLEERYDDIFRWADSDIAEVRELERDKLREMDIPFDERELNRLNEIERAQEREEVRRERAAARDAAADTPGGRQPTEEEIRSREVEGPVTTPRAFQVQEARLQYDPAARLTTDDVARIRAEVRNRIINQARDANGQRIPEQVWRNISNATLQSLAVVRTRAGILTLRVRFRDTQLPLLMHRYSSPVFGWSPSDVGFVNQIVINRLGGLPVGQTEAI